MIADLIADSDRFLAERSATASNKLTLEPCIYYSSRPNVINSLPVLEHITPNRKDLPILTNWNIPESVRRLCGISEHIEL
jgi:hypothetical protein